MTDGRKRDRVLIITKRKERQVGLATRYKIHF